jgi:hypothetical protein
MKPSDDVMAVVAALLIEAGDELRLQMRREHPEVVAVVGDWYREKYDCRPPWLSPQELGPRVGEAVDSYARSFAALNESMQPLADAMRDLHEAMVRDLHEAMVRDLHEAMVLHGGEVRDAIDRVSSAVNDEEPAPRSEYGPPPPRRRRGWGRRR